MSKKHSEYFWLRYGELRDRGYTDEVARETAAIIEERHRVKTKRAQADYFDNAPVRRVRHMNTAIYGGR